MTRRKNRKKNKKSPFKTAKVLTIVSMIMAIIVMGISVAAIIAMNLKAEQIKVEHKGNPVDSEVAEDNNHDEADISNSDNIENRTENNEKVDGNNQPSNSNNQPSNNSEEVTPQKQNTVSVIDDRKRRINSVNNLNPSVITGYWKLEGSRYAYLRFFQNKWSSSFMTLSGNKFITYEDDGWMGNVIKCYSQGIGSGGKKVTMIGSVMNDTGIGNYFNKESPNSSFMYLAENYGFEFVSGPKESDSRLVFNFGGKEYRFRRENVSGCVMFDVKARLLEYKPFATYDWEELNIDMPPDSVEYITVKKDSLPSPIKQYAKLDKRYFTVEYAGTTENGDYRFKITTSKDARGTSSFGFPSLEIYIEN